MGPGGAQRVASLVANAWAQQGKRVCLLTWDDSGKGAHPLDSRIARLELAALENEILRHAGVMTRMLVRTRRSLREMERSMRPRWPWRRPKVLKKAGGSSANGDEGSLSGRRTSWSDRVIDTVVLRPVLWLYQSNAFGLFSTFGRALVSRLILGHRVRAFRGALSLLRAPVIISFLTETNLYVLGAVREATVRIVISERNDPDLQDIQPGLAALREAVYREAHIVTSNSAGILEKMAAFVPPQKLVLLPNPIEMPVLGSFDVKRRNSFIAVARLVHQKGIDLLLSAFARIAKVTPEWNLEIVGDGPQRGDLETQAKLLGIADRVNFHGYVAHPQRILMSSRIFVLPSRFEGMPNALLEAMACELAPIVTDASPGPLEAVKHDQNGLVVPTENVIALAEAMQRLAKDENLARQLSANASTYVKEHRWPAVELHWNRLLTP
jgi:glycosyltransferase involved in cell wall biosynthesis